MIPDDVEAAIASTFGPALAIEPMTGGRSGAQVFSFTADGARYVARKLGALPATEAGKAERELAAMRIASELGVAPRVVYGDPSRGIVIMERIDGAPLTAGTARDTDPLGRLAAVLRVVHSGPAFPDGPTFRDRVDQLAAVPGVPGALIPVLRAVLAEIETSGVVAPCHRDLNPSNIIATTERVYLIDWEVAGPADPFLDLGQVGVWICRDAGERALLAERYLGRAPDTTEQRRLVLNRMLALGIYAGVFAMLSSLAGKQFPSPAPTLAEVFAKMAATGTPFAPEDMGAALYGDFAREAAAAGFVTG